MRYGPAGLAILSILALASCAPASRHPPRFAAGGARFAAMRAPLFVSPMGEPFRGGTAANGLERWFAGADNGDGALTLAELERDAARFFATLDVDGDGELGPLEINRYEREIAPEIQLGGSDMRRPGGAGGGMMRRRGGGGPGGGGFGGRRMGGGHRPEPGQGLEGAGRFGLLNIPEPVMDADADLNRGVGRSEFAAAAGRRFLLLDTDRNGRLTREELGARLPDIPSPRRRGRQRGN